MIRPDCLHIPTLYEGAPAQISWAVPDYAAGYILERQFNQTFEQASAPGRTWESLGYEGLTWTQIEAKDLSWSQFELLPPSFEIFRGMGIPVIGPELGRIWQELDQENLTWAQIEAKDQTWEQFEKTTNPGISWEGWDARWLNWDELEGLDLTWNQIEQQTSEEEHRAASDQIPFGTKSAQYRIKAYDQAGAESDCLTASLLPVIPVFKRDNQITFPVTANKTYYLQINGQGIRSFAGIELTLTYPSNQLRLDSFSPRQGNTAAKPVITSQTNGELRFTCTGTIPAGKEWSGLVTLLQFTALTSGTATITLS